MGYWEWLIHKFKAVCQLLRCLALEMRQSFRQNPLASAFARCFAVLVSGFFGVIYLACLIKILSWPFILKFAILVMAVFFWLSYLVYTLETCLTEDDP